MPDIIEWRNNFTDSYYGDVTNDGFMTAMHAAFANAFPGVVVNESGGRGAIPFELKDGYEEEDAEFVPQVTTRVVCGDASNSADRTQAAGDTDGSEYSNEDEEEEEENETSEEEEVEETQRMPTQMLVPDETLPGSQATPSSPLCHGTLQPSYGLGQEQDYRGGPLSQPLSPTGDGRPSQGSDAAPLLRVLLDTRHADKELATLTSSTAHVARRKTLLSRCPNVDRRCIVCRKIDLNPRHRKSAMRTTTMYPFCETCENEGRVCSTQSCGKKKPLTGYSLYLKSSTANKYGGKTVWWWFLRADCSQCRAQSQKRGLDAPK